jgi:cell division protein FtsB
MAQRLKQDRPDRAERRIRIRPLYLVLAVILAFFAFKFVQKTQQLQQLNREAAALRAENQQIIQQNASLHQHIRYYHSNQYVEEQARSVLGLARPGDISIIPTLRQPHPVVRSAPTVKYVAAQPTWQQWLHALFG